MIAAEQISENEALAELDILLAALENGDAAEKRDGHLSRIYPETGKYDCFGKQPAYESRPLACGHCKFGERDCNNEGYRLRRIEPKPHEAAVIAFPSLGRRTPTPEPESPAESDSESAVVTATTGYLAAQELAQTIEGLRSMTVEEVTASLQATSQQIRRDGKTEYNHLLRVQFVAASIELCDRGDMPVFRDVHHGRFIKGRPASEYDATLSHDLRLVDLYWIAKHHSAGRGKGFSKLLDNDGNLDHGKAWDFASTRRSHEDKSNDLILTPQIQAELFMIKTDAAKQKWYRLSQDRGKATTTIATAIDHSHGRKAGDPEQLWKLYALCKMNDWRTGEILGSACRLFGQTVTTARLRTDIKWMAGCLGVE